MADSVLVKGKNNIGIYLEHHVCDHPRGNKISKPRADGRHLHECLVLHSHSMASMHSIHVFT